MKKLVCLICFLFMAVAPAAVYGQSGNAGPDIDKMLWSLYNRQVLQDPEAGKSAVETNERFIKALRNAYERWEVRADAGPLNQYRRGVYFFIDGMSGNTDEFFRKALPLLEEARNNGIKADLIMPLDEMISLCKNTRVERTEYLNNIKREMKNKSNVF